MWEKVHRGIMFLARRPNDPPPSESPEVLSLAQRKAERGQAAVPSPRPTEQAGAEDAASRRARIAAIEALDEDDLPEDSIALMRRGTPRSDAAAARLARVEATMAQRGGRSAARSAAATLSATTEAADPASPPRQGAQPADPPDVRPTVGPAVPRRRHWLVLASFVAVVILPLVLSGWYLWSRAADRYASVVGFSVRTEEIGSAIELLGGVAQMSGSSSSDTDILYNFIQSQDLVRRVDAELDLRGMWSKPDPAVDPVFSYHPPGTIEDLTDYWRRMVKVYNDGGTGLIDIRVQAFDPIDAQRITQMIFDESSEMINELSAIARADATRYAREELDQAVERLKSAREALTLFRNRNQIVDPNASIQSQMGLLSQLQVQLAETLIELDMLRQITSDTDQRVAQALRRIDVIEARIVDERRKLGMGEATEGGGNVFADMVGEFERLSVDVQFAEQAYTAALASFDAAVADTRRQSRYIAAHIPPTRAERSDYPDRPMLLGLIGLFLFAAWGLAVLSVYAVKDRR